MAARAKETDRHAPPGGEAVSDPLGESVSLRARPRSLRVAGRAPTPENRRRQKHVAAGIMLYPNEITNTATVTGNPAYSISSYSAHRGGRVDAHRAWGSQLRAREASHSPETTLPASWEGVALPRSCDYRGVSKSLVM